MQNRNERKVEKHIPGQRGGRPFHVSWKKFYHVTRSGLDIYSFSLL